MGDGKVGVLEGELIAAALPLGLLLVGGCLLVLHVHLDSLLAVSDFLNQQALRWHR